MQIFIKGKDDRGCLVIDEKAVFFYFPDVTDNQCEWDTLVSALEYISGNEITGSEIFTDSILIYRQIHGEWRVKNKNLKEIYYKWNNLKNILQDYKIVYSYVSGCENPARSLLCE
jgi:ribonuclease HI